jgi:hypothetical protein
LFVIETKQMQDGRVPAMDVHLVLDRFVSMIVGATILKAAFHASTGHPHRLAFVIEVATGPSVGVRCATKFAAIQIFLKPDSAYPRFARRHSVSLGVRSGQRLFLNNSGTIDATAPSLAVGEHHFFVLIYKADSNTTTTNLRVCRVNDLVDETQPSVWTVLGPASAGPTKFASIRLSLGTQAAAQIDELRICDSWNAAVDFTN